MNDKKDMDLSALTNDPPRYSSEEIVLPEQPDEPDHFDDEENATAEEVEADFDAEEQNAKGDSA